MAHHLNRRCVSCPAQAPVCACGADQQCTQIAQTCTQCASFTCSAKPSTLSSSGGGGSKSVSKGALAGAVIGSLILLGAVVAIFIWYRRRSKALAQAEAPVDVPQFKETPASAADVLNRPDPNEKMVQQQQRQDIQQRIAPAPPTNVAFYHQTQINLDPESQGAVLPANAARYTPPRRTSAQSNPFEDSHSILTSSTDAQSNVIPIALVPRTSAVPSTPGGVHPASPHRPARSPEQDLNLEHVNVSKDTLPQPSPGYANSGASASRNSFMSEMTSATDILNEAPQIVTPQTGVVRQVFGMSKAAVVQNPGLTVPNSPMTIDSLRAGPPSITRPSIRSPLAMTSFGVTDIVQETDEESVSNGQEDPFDDEHSTVYKAHSPRGNSVTTFGSVSSQWTPDGPRVPRVAQLQEQTRPMSMATQASSIISANITSATRVTLGVPSPGVESDVPVSAALSTPRVLHRMTSGRLVTPPSGNSEVGTLQEQQARALAHAQAKAREQGLDRRVSSGSSVVSGRDSILESFPFVPPSPISNRPPRSPLAQQSFQQEHEHGSAMGESDETETETDQSQPPLTPPDRRTLGMSTGSLMTNASTGLGSFPFQISNGSEVQAHPPSSFNSGALDGRTRASLDTLALTSALSSYPLGFDSEGAPPMPKPTV